MKDLAVLIPSYNDNEALRKTLRSIDEKDNSFTVVVVDDGSPEPVEIDQSEYLFSIKLIRLPENQGITGALNAGLRYILDEGFAYIARLDAADLNRPARLLTQYQRMKEESDLGMLGSNVVFRDETTHKALFTTNLPLSSESLRRRIVFHNCFIHPSVMIRTAVLKTTGLYDPRHRHIEDFVLFTRITEATKTANLEQPLVDCYIREQGISGKNFRAQMLSGIRFKLQNPRPLDGLWWGALINRTAKMFFPPTWRTRIKKALGFARGSESSETPAEKPA